jgi:hypothetical protein
MVFLLGMMVLPQASVASTRIVEGPNNVTIAIDPACIERSEASGLHDTDHQRPVWIDCEFQGKRVTLLMATLPRVLSNWNDFRDNKTDDIYELITAGTDWYQLRNRLWFWGWSFEGYPLSAKMHTNAWLCPDAERRCGKPEQFLELKVVGTQAVTIALLAIGDFEVVDVKSSDGKTVGSKRVFPDPVEKMIAAFDFEM